MKKQKVYMIFCVLIAVALHFFLSPFSFGISSEHSHRNAAVMPESLICIENEAFTGTMFQKLLFSEGLLWVGDFAFSEMDSLREASFPRSINYISESAFSGSGLEKICGTEGSYAQKWAEQHQIKFEISDCFLAATPNLRLFSELMVSLFGIAFLPMSVEAVKIKGYLNTVLISMRPQDRPELHPIDYRFP